MNQIKKAEWILRIAIFGEFLGHGIFAIQGKAVWAEWISLLTRVSSPMAEQLLFLIGTMDVIVAILVLVKPFRLLLLWASIWGFWTALIRPIVGDPVWDFVERWANWGAPLALLTLKGWPKNAKEWLQ